MTDRLREALVDARSLIERERQIMFDSFKQISGKYKGQVIDREANKDIAEFDAALATIDSALSASPAEPEEATEAITAAMIKAGMAACQTRTIPGNLAAIYTAMRSAASGGDTV